MITVEKFSTLSFRLVLFTALWWVITEAAANSWYLGVPVVVIAAWVSVLLLPGVPLSLPGILRFIPFFLWQSLRGGVDVARCALHPSLPISPAMVEYRWRLPEGFSRLFMANTVSLLPGTLSAELDENCLHLHVLDKSGDFSSELVDVEQRVADLFGLDLSPNEKAE